MVYYYYLILILNEFICIWLENGSKEMDTDNVVTSSPTYNKPYQNLNHLESNYRKQIYIILSFKKKSPDNLTKLMLDLVLKEIKILTSSYSQGPFTVPKWQKINLIPWPSASIHLSPTPSCPSAFSRINCFIKKKNQYLDEKLQIKLWITIKIIISFGKLLYCQMQLVQVNYKR